MNSLRTETFLNECWCQRFFNMRTTLIICGFDYLQINIAKNTRFVVWFGIRLFKFHVTATNSEGNLYYIARLVRLG